MERFSALDAPATLTTAPLDATAAGEPVTLTTMNSACGVTVKFMSYGGAITQIIVPDRNGRLANIVLGFSTLSDYEVKCGGGGLYCGALVGRDTNRIAGGRFTLDGGLHRLAINSAPNALHGGLKGFDKRVWEVRPLAVSGEIVSARHSLLSPDGEEGYPGTLRVGVTYTLSDPGLLTIKYEASTDKTTVINLTNHSYFNLAGAGSANGLFEQLLTIDADVYTPTDVNAIPLEETASVEGTPFDFRQPMAIGARLRADDEQLIRARGYDHNWVLNKREEVHPRLAVRAFDPSSGCVVKCLTTEPGVQIYTSHFLAGLYAGNRGVYRQTHGFTIETQHIPDSANQPSFPTTVLKPGQTFDSTTVFRFGTQD